MEIEVVAADLLDEIAVRKEEQDRQGVRAALLQLAEFGEKHPENVEVQVAVANGAVAALDIFEADVVWLGVLYDAVESAYARCPDNDEVRDCRATLAPEVADACRRALHASERSCEALYGHLEALAGQRPQDALVQIAFAEGGADVISRLHSRPDLATVRQESTSAVDRAETVYSKLQALAARLPDEQEVQDNVLLATAHLALLYSEHCLYSRSLETYDTLASRASVRLDQPATLEMLILTTTLLCERYLADALEEAEKLCSKVEALVSAHAGLQKLLQLQALLYRDLIAAHRDNNRPDSARQAYQKLAAVAADCPQDGLIQARFRVGQHYLNRPLQP